MGKLWKEQRRTESYEIINWKMIGSWCSERVARAPTNGKCKAKNKRNKRTRVKNCKTKNNPSSEKIQKGMYLAIRNYKIKKWETIKNVEEE